MSHTHSFCRRLLGAATALMLGASLLTQFGGAVSPLSLTHVAAADAPVGYGAATTGGAGGTSITVTNGEQFVAAIAAKDSTPLTIYIDGKITLANTPAEELLIKNLSDISIIGVGTNGECDGIGIRLYHCENIIIQNMKIHHVLKDAGQGDSIGIESSSNIWVDHCELYNVFDGDESKKDNYDGLLDCKKTSSNLTYSYNYLHDSWKTMLCGFSDSDNFDRTFTMHHNIFENCNSRLPLFRFGHAHIYNNYYHNIPGSTINSRMGAEVFVENNVFENVKEPVCSRDSSAKGSWNLSGNVFNNCSSANVSSATEQSWYPGMANTCNYRPPYDYYAEGTDNLVASLKSSVGVGKIAVSPNEPIVTTTTTTPAPAVTTSTTSQSPDNPVQPVEGAIYCAPDASPDGSGTPERPMQVERAISAVQPGGAILCLDGVYRFSAMLNIPEENSGMADAYKRISAAPGASVVFDFSALAVDGSNRGVQLEGSYWHWQDITIQKTGDNGMLLAGDNNRIERCVFRNNQDTGLQLSRGKTSYVSIDQWPTNNLILNCTSYDNCDDATMENADGFAAKLTCGNGNIFDGCMSYNNSDDGWDLYAKTETGPIGVVTIRNCVSFRNGWTSDGRGYGDCDGNGFKLGGAGVGTAHVVENCIAFENLHHGFTDNNNPAFGSLTNCTSYANAQGGSKANFQLDRCTAGTFRSILSYVGNGKCGSDKFNGTMTNGVFFNSSKYYRVSEQTTLANSKAGEETASPTDGDFVSVTAPTQGSDFHSVWRNADGSLNLHGFLSVKPDSHLAGLGAIFSAEEPIVTTTTTTIIITTTTTTTTKEPIPTYLPGDVDENGSITIGDLVLLARYVSQDKDVSLTTNAVHAADLNGDSLIDASDIGQLGRYLAGLSSITG